jgi:hypothetical protein
MTALDELIDQLRVNPDSAYNPERFKVPHTCRQCGRRLPAGRRRYCDRYCAELAGARRRFEAVRGLDGRR